MALNVLTETIVSNLEKLIPGLIQDCHVPGASIALIRNGECAWAEGFGVKNATTGEPVNDRTTFQSASFDKPLFAYAAVKMCESGELGLDTPLEDYLQEPFVVSESRLTDVTLRMVLSHTSGLSHARSPEIVLDPGAVFSYSTGGINYLAAVIAHLSSISVSEFMSKRVLSPLGMQDSCFTEASLPVDVSVGHDHQDRPSAARVGTTAATLYITAADYAKFMIEFMRLDQRDPVAEMLKPQARLDEALSWGLGWGLQHNSDGLSYWHWGGANVRNFALAFPEQKRGAVILTNSAHGDRVWAEIIGAVIGGNQPALSRLRWVSKDHGEALRQLHEGFASQATFTCSEMAQEALTLTTDVMDTMPNIELVSFLRKQPTIHYTFSLGTASGRGMLTAFMPVIRAILRTDDVDLNAIGRTDERRLRTWAEGMLSKLSDSWASQGLSVWKIERVSEVDSVTKECPEIFNVVSTFRLGGDSMESRSSTMGNEVAFAISYQASMLDSFHPLVRAA